MHVGLYTVRLDHRAAFTRGSCLCAVLFMLLTRRCCPAVAAVRAQIEALAGDGTVDVDVVRVKGRDKGIIAYYSYAQ